VRGAPWEKNMVVVSVQSGERIPVRRCTQNMR
jgi:hypothetical protein